MLALHHQQQQKLRSKSLHGHYGSQTVARSKDIASSHNPSRLLTNNTFIQQYDPKLLIPMQAPDSRSFIHQQYYMKQKQQQQQQQLQYHYPTHESLMSAIESQAMLNRPLCRCRVMYLGSSVPHVTKNGLHGIQEPLKHLYPEEKFNANKLTQQQQQAFSSPATGSSTLLNNATIDISHLSSSLGIDSWLSVWSNGLLLENVDEFGREIKRFFFIESLHYCAAVRFFDTTTLVADQRNTTRISSSAINYNRSSNSNSSSNNDNTGAENGDLNNNDTIQRNKNLQNSSSSCSSGKQKPQQQQAELESTTSIIYDGEPADEIDRQQKQRKNAIRFLPLDAPLFQCPGMLDANHPPMFASIMRRTTGIKVLECHAFICRRDAAANALVRCCTHAYADFLNAKRLSIELGQEITYNEYSRGATINGISSESRRKRATSVASRPAKTRNTNSPTYDIADINFNNKTNINNHHQFNSSTGASNEDNSLEASSEDNYAIISKHHHQRSKAFPDRKSQLEDHKARKRNRKSKTEKNDSKCASTKSLFYDFTPKSRDILPQSECCTARESKDGEKLSHSLDLLNQDFNENCCLNSSDSNDVVPIKYSIVKNKRHSKSMQNLDGPFEFTAPATARLSSRLRKGRKSRRSVAQEMDKSRKAASYQDMMANISSSYDRTPQQKEQQLSPGSHTKPACHTDGNIVLDCNCSGVSKQKPSAIQQEPISNLSRGRRPSSGKREQGQQTLSRSRKSRDIQNQLEYMEQQQQQQQLQQLHQSCQNSSLLIYQQPHHLANFPQTSPPLNLAYSPLYLHAPSSGPPQACYMSPVNQVANHYHQPMYAAPSGGSIYDQITSHRNPYMAQSTPIAVPLTTHINHQQSPYIHPNQLLHHHQHNGLAQQPHLQANMYNGSGDICSQTMILPKKSQKAKSSLARFRCLSPPVNFVTHASQSVYANGASYGGSNRNSHQLTSTMTAPQTQMSATTTTTTTTTNTTIATDKTGKLDAGVAPHDSSTEICCNKQVVNSANGDHINGCFEDDDGNNNEHVTAESHDLNVDGVVSAKPSFISSAANVRGKKMSWIKRLSLTMISGSTTPVEGEQQVNKMSTDPNGNQRISVKENDVSDKQIQAIPQGSEQNSSTASSTLKKTKRKSRLFSGSLTLGRKKQQQQHTKLQITQQQQQQPTTATAVSNSSSTS